MTFLSFGFIIVALSTGPSYSDTVASNNRCDFLRSNNSSKWCHRNLSSYVSYTEKTEKNLSNDSDFDRCTCGKRWPLWLVPIAGYRAYEVRPDSIINASNSSSYSLLCHEHYRGVTPCTMTCEALPLDQTVTSLTNITCASVEMNCTLSSNIRWTIKIPIDHYLIYLPDRTTENLTLTCSNATSVIRGAPSTPIICHYQMNQNSFLDGQYLSLSMTNRSIVSSCVDYISWTFGHLFCCPEQHCDICGKGRLSPSVLLSALEASLDSSQYDFIHLKNCAAGSIFGNWTTIDDFRCIGLINFTNNSLDMTSILYGCTIDCFFNWKTRMVQVVRYRSNSSLFYDLTSVYFHHFSIRCQTSIDDTTTDSSTMLQSQTVLARQYIKNGIFCVLCNISSGPGLLSRLYINNLTCIPINSSYYSCFCLLWHYLRDHCESLINLSENVTSQNAAQDAATPMNLTHKCINSDSFVRRYEMTNSTLNRKKTITRSFAYVVIITFVLCLLFILILDLLKYCFGFDPVGDDHRRMEAKKLSKKKVPKRSTVMFHQVYVNRSNLETIPEE